MKLITNILALAAISTAALTSCTTDQVSKATAAVQSGLTVAQGFGALKGVSAADLAKVNAGLTVVSRLDLTKADVDSLITQASATLSDLQASGLIKPTDAAEVNKALAAAQFLWSLKSAFSAQRGHDSEIPKLT